MKLYAFEFLECRWETGWSVRSLHITKAGAYKAMRKYIFNEVVEKQENRLRYGKDKTISGLLTKFQTTWAHRPDGDGWRVREWEIQD